MNSAKIRKLLVGTPRMTPYGWEVPSLVTGEVYEITQGYPYRWLCTCYAPKRPCKHIQAVERVLSAEDDAYPICT